MSETDETAQRRADGGASALRRVRTGFVVSQVFFGLATSLFDMFYPLYLDTVQVDAQGAGLVFSIGFVAMALVVLPIGMALNTVGVHRAMLISSFGFGLTMLLIPLLAGLIPHLVVFTVNSVCAAVMLVTVNSVIGAAVEDDALRLATFTAGFLAFLAASAVGNLIGIVLAEVGGDGGAERSALIVSGVLALGIGASRLLMRGGPERLVHGARGELRLSQEWRDLRDNVSRLLSLAMLAALIGGAGVLAIRFVSIIVVQHFGMDEKALGWLLVGDRMASFVGLFLLAPVMKRWNPFRVAGFVMLAALALQSLSAGAAVAATYVVWYLCRQGLHYAQMPILDHAANLDTPATSRTLFNGVQRMGIYLGSALASLGYGALLAANQFGWAMIASGGLAALAGVCYLGLARRRD